MYYNTDKMQCLAKFIFKVLDTSKIKTWNCLAHWHRKEPNCWFVFYQSWNSHWSYL